MTDIEARLRECERLLMALTIKVQQLESINSANAQIIATLRQAPNQ